ncbi:MAG: UvrB/UvrC motif-containing protein [Planctomycetia bacterium]
MKCQHCDRPAVFHITELEAGTVRELHLCEEHARSYLNQSEGAQEAAEGKPGGALTGPLGVGQTADELAALDQKACDMCGITFFEFRNQGRLGCPHDYVHFEKELEPLIANIHGATEHIGRVPSRAAAIEMPPEGSAELTRVIALRRDMKDAIASEDYEKAKENRDLIRSIEERWLGPAAVPPAPRDTTP